VQNGTDRKIGDRKMKDGKVEMVDVSTIPVEHIERAILLIRGQKVLLDRDLAELYEVPTKRLNERVRRNLKRFPEDFMFQLTADEAEASRSQIATLTIRGYEFWKQTEWNRW
jgi:hypothetical protein